MTAAHTPFVHAPPRQDLPHAPQFAPSLAKVTSHPFAKFLSQSPLPVLQVAAQAPALQLADPLVTEPHELPHFPQFATSVCTSPHCAVAAPPSSRPLVDKQALAEKNPTARIAYLIFGHAGRAVRVRPSGSAGA